MRGRDSVHCSVLLRRIGGLYARVSPPSLTPHSLTCTPHAHNTRTPYAHAQPRPALCVSTPHHDVRACVRAATGGTGMQKARRNVLPGARSHRQDESKGGSLLKARRSACVRACVRVRTNQRQATSQPAKQASNQPPNQPPNQPTNQPVTSALVTKVASD